LLPKIDEWTPFGNKLFILAKTVEPKYELLSTYCARPNLSEFHTKNIIQQILPILAYLHKNSHSFGLPLLQHAIVYIVDDKNVRVLLLKNFDVPAGTMTDDIRQLGRVLGAMYEKRTLPKVVSEFKKVCETTTTLQELQKHSWLK